MGVRSSTKSSLERKRNPYSSTSMMWSLLMVSVVTLPLTWSSPLSSTSSPPSTCNMTACSSIDQAWTCSNTADTNCQTSSRYCNQAGGWTGQCVDDNGTTKLLSDQNIHSNNSYSHGYPSSNNSVTTCIKMCRSKGYTYAGVEYGYQCFCGNTPPPSSKILPQSQCWYKCYGDPDQFCGGFHTMNVYATEECHCCPPVIPDPEPPTCNKTACSSKGQGWTCANTNETRTGCESSPDYCNDAPEWDGQCVDDSGKKNLGFHHIDTHKADKNGHQVSTNSVTSCIQSCLDAGFTYAAMEDGWQCFCGNDPPPTSLILPQSRCNYKCYGNQDQYCGGYHTMNVYATTDECECCPTTTSTTATTTPTTSRTTTTTRTTTTAPCEDTGCKKEYKDNAECVFIKDPENWENINKGHDTNTTWKEGLCKGVDGDECCRCFKYRPTTTTTTPTTTSTTTTTTTTTTT